MTPKLVRDLIPEIIKENAEIPHTHIADEKEFWEELKKKLQEEVEEFIKDETIEELADINEVLLAIYEHKNISAEEVESIREQKANKRGGFKKRIILERMNG
ncbi:MAG: nucleoside triphosphate pyrophosphohydrolase [Nanoarchaeota archaeon]|nr:nucleoside triphosphate pyrophosphohydrolase [Nanoarchaeota archaeon]